MSGMRKLHFLKDSFKSTNTILWLYASMFSFSMNHVDALIVTKNLSVLKF